MGETFKTMKKLTIPGTVSKPTWTAYKALKNQLNAKTQKVAEYFGKRHDNVLRDIDVLIGGGVLGFEGCSYRGGNGKTLPMFNMKRQAWMILALGFNGEKALQFKQDFVDVFDRMEATIRDQAGDIHFMPYSK